MITEAGYAIQEQVLGRDEVEPLTHALAATVGSGRGGARNLLDEPIVLGLAFDTRVLELAKSAVGPDARPVRAIFFDKTPDANWRVTWHQDLTIAVRERLDVPGFGPWSVKEGIPHVQPPAGILERMVALRFHLDDCGAENGPVRVLPGSHLSGKIDEQEYPTWRERVAEVPCLVERGGVLLMRPLLLHASSPATTPVHRRVLHIEYAGCDLPGGLDWHWASSHAGTHR